MPGFHRFFVEILIPNLLLKPVRISGKKVPDKDGVSGYEPSNPIHSPPTIRSRENKDLLFSYQSEKGEVKNAKYEIQYI